MEVISERTAREMVGLLISIDDRLRAIAERDEPSTYHAETIGILLSISEQLKAISEAIDRQGTPTIQTVGLLSSIDERLRTIVERDEPNIPIVYPRDGGYKTLPKGDTAIDFFEGIVTLPDRSHEEMGNSLKKLEMPYVRSLLVFADRRVDLTWEGAKYTVLPGQPIPLFNLKMRNLLITADADTNVRVLASTHTEGVPAFEGELGGDPVAKLATTTTTSQSYVTVLDYSVPSGRTLRLNALAFNEGSTPEAQFEKLQWRLTIRGEEQFADKSSSTNFSMSFRSKLPGGTSVKVEAKSTDGTSITPEVILTGELI